MVMPVDMAARWRQIVFISTALQVFRRRKAVGELPAHGVSAFAELRRETCRAAAGGWQNPPGEEMGVGAGDRSQEGFCGKKSLAAGLDAGGALC